MFRCLSHLHHPILSSLHRRRDPHITHHELLRWNPTLLCYPTNHRTSLPFYFLSSYVLSPHYWWFCSLILTSGCRSDHQFLRVTWDIVFISSLLELILGNFGSCNPAAHASLVTAGGRMFEDRLTTDTHVYAHTFTDYNSLLAWSLVRRVVWWFWLCVIAYSTLAQFNQWKDYECVSNKWRKREWSVFNVFCQILWNNIFWWERDLTRKRGEIDECTKCWMCFDKMNEWR